MRNTLLIQFHIEQSGHFLTVISTDLAGTRQLSITVNVFIEIW